ncbi:hypothetical protein BDZ85DRAFT_282346 [Elsinoe ampelina]|uniref:Invertebrate defensins family profile domain-containing protein n=1 Tax=Elsinoe ampelina TaxID=302913 RepID=A0A6A6G957_9PEZI|nr:hypothetical protein BDZ85DRAFT_282346 [Elsinoe ampelina]
MRLEPLLFLFGLALAAPGPIAEPNAAPAPIAAPVGFTDYSEVFSLEKRQTCGSKLSTIRTAPLTAHGLADKLDCNRECCRKRPSGNCDPGGISCGRSYCDSNQYGFFCRCVCGYGK